MSEPFLMQRSIYLNIVSFARNHIIKVLEGVDDEDEYDSFDFIRPYNHELTFRLWESSYGTNDPSEYVWNCAVTTEEYKEDTLDLEHYHHIFSVESNKIIFVEDNLKIVENIG